MFCVKKKTVARGSRSQSSWFGVLIAWLQSRTNLVEFLLTCFLRGKQLMVYISCLHISFNHIYHFFFWWQLCSNLTSKFCRVFWKSSQKTQNSWRYLGPAKRNRPRKRKEETKSNTHQRLLRFGCSTKEKATAHASGRVQCHGWWGLLWSTHSTSCSDSKRYPGCLMCHLCRSICQLINWFLNSLFYFYLWSLMRTERSIMLERMTRGTKLLPQAFSAYERPWSSFYLVCMLILHRYRRFCCH